MLTLEAIHTYYGDSHVLQGVSLNVQRGEVVALLGRNGVGKTTTIGSIIGFTPPREGRILFNDKDLARVSSHITAQMGIGLVPQGRRIFPTLSVRENISLAARNTRNGGWTMKRILETFPPLAQRLNNLGSQLSGGEQQMLAIARALMTNPELILLDEPSEGLAPLIVKAIGEILRGLREKGLSILLVEQNLSLALGVANRVYVMNKGAIVFEGTPEKLRADVETLHRYLGV